MTVVQVRAAGTRAAALVAVAVVLATVHLPGRPTTLCGLRMLTGLPCPMCGGTTAGVRLGRADVIGAVQASPLAVLAAAAFLLQPLRLVSVPKRVLLPVLLAVAAAGELWQLHRFGFL